MKLKKIYIDTCVALNYLEDRTSDSLVFMQSINTRKWELKTSTFTLVELSDYQKNSIYFWDKLSERKSLNYILRKVRDQKSNRKLTRNQLRRVQAWLDAVIKTFPTELAFHDLADTSAWQWAKMISESSNVTAKDSVHLATAFALAVNNDCDFFVTDDSDLKKEALELIKGTRLIKKIKIMSSGEFGAEFPPLKKKSASLNLRGVSQKEEVS